MKKTALYFVLILTFISCKKEKINIDNNTAKIEVKTYDTIKPNSYLPVYPKSWWKYTLDDSIVYVDVVSSEYKLHSYLESPDYVETKTYSDSVYVPFLNNQPIYGYDKIIHIDAPYGNYYTKHPIISEKIGTSFSRTFIDTRYGDFNEYLKVKEKKFDGKDSIIILEGHWVWGPNINKKRIQEYVKGIGMRKSFLIDNDTNDTLSSTILLDYFIND